MQGPLYWIETPFPGKLVISARPRGGDWLEDDITAWQRAGINAVTSLLTPEEVKDLDLGAEMQLCAAQSIAFSLISNP